MRSAHLDLGIGKKTTKPTKQSVQAELEGGKSVKNLPPPNLAPPEAGRRGAFRQAKRDAGIPVSQQPNKVTIIKDRATGKPIKLYEFTNIYGKKVEIRSDRYGHYYGEGNSQNRGPHFNAGKKGTKLKDHYDYK